MSGYKTQLGDYADFLDQEATSFAAEITAYWKGRQRAIPAKELKSTLMYGTPQINLRNQIHDDVQDFLLDIIMPHWEKAWKETGGGVVNSNYGSFLTMRMEALEEHWRRSYIGSLQRVAVWLQEEVDEDLSAEDSAFNDPEALRYLYGLHPEDAIAVLKYQHSLVSKGMLRRAVDFARDLLTRRARTMAEAELAEAYTHGLEDRAVQTHGYNNYTKVWHIDPLSENVCKLCSEMDGEEREPGEQFTHGVERAPLHNKCRCLVEHKKRV